MHAYRNPKRKPINETGKRGSRRVPGSCNEEIHSNKRGKRSFLLAKLAASGDGEALDGHLRQRKPRGEEQEGE